jgi:hypothetical protein
MIFNRNAVVSFALESFDKAGATALRLNDPIILVSQCSRSGNPGLEVAAPLGHRQNIQELSHRLYRFRFRICRPTAQALCYAYLQLSLPGFR